MNRIPQVLICDDDEHFRLASKLVLQERFKPTLVSSGEEALIWLKKQSFDLVLMDLEFHGEKKGFHYLTQVKELDPDTAVVIVSGYQDFESVREAMRLGAVDYVLKDFQPEELVHTLCLALERKKLLLSKKQKDFEVLGEQKKHVLIGESPSVVELRRVFEKVRRSSANVVITGETGTGKEVVARHLRKTLPDGSIEAFVATDSATIQSSTAESLLFGHVKGAFTGAEKMAKGIFEEADGGIVYFDEIANMPLEIQGKLLRVIQEKEITRLGSSKVIPLEFRVICATNRDLEEMVTQGQFKEDLLNRLNVIPIQVPPLRKRKEDIPLLIEHFQKLHSDTSLIFTQAANEALLAYHWPGNIRELSNLVAYLSTMLEQETVDLSDLPTKIRGDLKSPAKVMEIENQEFDSFYERIQAYENKVLCEEYQRNHGNISQLAKKLKMDRSHLYTKLKNYGIHSSKQTG